MRQVSVVAAGLAALMLAAVACGGDDDGGATDTGATNGYRVTIASPDQLSTGPTRFIFALDDARGGPVTNARALLQFYFIDPKAGNRPTIKNSVEASPVEFEEAHEVALADGSARTLGPGETGIFANDIAFDQAGDWQLKITGDAGTSNLGIIEIPFVVTLNKPGLQPGSAAPNSTPEIEAALSSSKPLIVRFASEGACGEAVCGALAETASKLEADHGDEAEFLTFSLDDAPAWVASDWGVEQEGAVFFIDGTGTVRARVQTIATYADLESLLAELTPG